MKKKNLVIIFLALVLVMSVIAGCSSNKPSNNNPSVVPDASSDGNEEASEAVSSTLEPYELTMMFPLFGDTPREMKKVQDAVNKITEAKINTTVTIEPIGVGNYVQQLNLKYSGGEKLDVAFIFTQLFNSFAAQGKLQDISEILKEDGQGIIDAVGEKYVTVPTINGKLYGVPIAPIVGSGVGYYMRKDIVEKYNIDLSSIKTYSDIEKVLEVVKQNEPNMVPLAASSGLNPVRVSAYSDYDVLGDGFAVIPIDSDSYTVENQYATPRYADLVNVTRKWFQAGYINKDAATTSLLPFDMVKAGTFFSFFSRSTAGNLEGISKDSGYEMVSVDLSPHYITTSEIMTGVWTVAQQSKDPSRAVMFLDLLYTDKDLANLLVWGIEGEDYVKVSDNIVDYPEGKDATSVGYNLKSSAWTLGNLTLFYFGKDENSQKWEEAKEWADNSIQSKLLGFTFDSEPVKNELVALNNVYNQYGPVLETGSVDPANELPKFLEKLEASGIDVYIEEAQKQVTEWAAKQ